MRGLKSTLVLLVVFLGLLAYIYFYEMKKKPEETDAKPKVFAALQAEKIEEVRIKATSGEWTHLRKADGKWQVAAPEAAAADESEASAIGNSLASLAVERVVEENPSSLDDFGLAKPRVEVQFRAAGEKDFKHLLIGEKTATGGDLYAKLPNEKKVFLISGYLDTTFNRTPFDLRDKTILKFDRDKVDAVELATPDHAVKTAKRGDQWRVSHPFDARADFGAVEGVIGRLQTASMKSIAAKEATDLTPYGLDKPETTATVAAGSARATLLVGKKSDGGDLYAKDASRPMVFTVDATLADDLKKTPSDFRNKDLFDFRGFNATRLDLARDGQTYAFEKVKGAGKDATETWKQVAPKPADVDQSKMDDLLSKVSNLRAASFADEKTATGLEKPALVVTATFDEGKKEEKVSFAKAGADVYAQRLGEPGAAKVETKDFDEALKALDSVKK